jgi:hypothetical protein
MSNVLRRNSAVDHQTFATRLHRLIEAYHKPAAAAEKPGAGDSAPTPQVPTSGN